MDKGIISIRSIYILAYNLLPHSIETRPNNFVVAAKV